MRHPVMAACAVASLLVGCAAVPPPSPAAPVTERASIPGVVIPLYVYPGGDGARAWDAVAAAARQSSDVPIIVVVNPDNGPGARTDANYRSRTQGLADAGVELVAYVALGYGHRPASEIRADLRRWRRLYRSVTGVFFDEVPVPGDHLPRRDARRYLSDLTAYARGRGFSGTVIGNPGTPAPREYFEPEIFDLVVVHEDRRWPDPDALDGAPSPEKSVVLVYGDGVWDRTRAQHIIEDGRYLFVDDHSRDITGTGSSPWTFFPDNLPEQLKLLWTLGYI